MGTQELTLGWTEKRQAILDRLSGDLSVYSNGNRCYLLNRRTIHLDGKWPTRGVDGGWYYSRDGRLTGPFGTREQARMDAGC